MDKAEVDATHVVGIAICVNVSTTACFWDEDEFFGRNYVTMEVAAEVCLEGIDADFGWGASVRVFGEIIDLAPKNISLNTSCHAYLAVGLTDNITSQFSL